MPAPAIKLDATGAGGAAFPGVIQGGSNIVVSDVGPDQTAFGAIRDSFWPKYVGAWVVVSLLLIALSVRLVGPVGGWRPRRPRRGPRPTAEVTDAPA
jgi:hypothetical protein